MTSRLSLLPTLLLLFACAPHERLAELSAPEVSCAQSEIEVSDILANKGAARYTATCPDGKVYRCISMGKPFGGDPETTCSPKSDDVEAEDSGESTSSAAVARGQAAPRGVLPGGWPLVRIEACGAELTMPPNAKRSERIEPTTQSPIHLAEASAGTTGFSFSCARLPGTAGERATPDEILGGAARGSIEAINGELIQSRKLSQPPGRTLLVKVQGAQMAMRIWLQGDWLYSANVAPIERLPDGAVAEYLDRIQVDPTL